MSQTNNVFDENHVGREHPDCDMNPAIRQEGKRKRSGGAEDQNPSEQRNTSNHKRHTVDQVQEMEKFFERCPKPSEEQRRELGQRLSLEPEQIKFWFQNRRSHRKSQHKSIENTQLKAENNKLRVERSMYGEAFIYTACMFCDGNDAVAETSFDREQRLRHENARLCEAINEINAFNEYHLANTMQPIYSHLPSGSGSAPGNLDHGMGTSFAPPTSSASERNHFGW